MIVCLFSSQKKNKKNQFFFKISIYEGSKLDQNGLNKPNCVNILTICRKKSKFLKFWWYLRPNQPKIHYLKQFWKSASFWPKACKTASTLHCHFKSIQHKSLQDYRLDFSLESVKKKFFSVCQKRPKNE